MVMDSKQPAEAFSFQAEVSRLLHLMIHSVYTEKEIFLRELISNASDACDKLRYEAVKRTDLLGEDTELKISLQPDKNAKTLTVSDNGIGMSRQDLIENLGTIARSGTKIFLDKLAQEKEGSNLIGQFGVGFYSAFMVADKVEVVSRQAGEQACHRWISEGGDGFAIEELSPEEAKHFGRGTRITLFLNEESLKFLEPYEIERIVNSYSDHISFPVVLKTADSDPRQLNTGNALWMRPKSDITSQDYTSFYKQIAVPFDEPSLTLHYKAEGRTEYTVLLFIPTLKPFDLYDPARRGRVRLYVRRVFITDEASLLPPWLRFVRGVIDSQDVPLNISREMLQKNPVVEAIYKAVTNKVLSELKKTADKDRETYEKIWETFGPVMKEGLYEDPHHRDDLLHLLRFRSSKEGASKESVDSLRSLKDYLADMPAAQKAIYYLTGDSLDHLKASPLLEGYKARGVEVLLLSDPVDHFWVTNTLGYESKPFMSLTQGDADISDIPLLEGHADENSHEADAKSATLLVKLKEVLQPVISDVKISKRLVKSPVCLVAPVGGPDRGLERIIGGEANKRVLPVLEINLNHDLVRGLSEKMTGEGQMEGFEDLSWFLFDQARILEGELPVDPAKFAERLNRLVVRGL